MDGAGAQAVLYRLRRSATPPPSGDPDPGDNPDPGQGGSAIQRLFSLGRRAVCGAAMAPVEGGDRVRLLWTPRLLLWAGLHTGLNLVQLLGT